MCSTTTANTASSSSKPRRRRRKSRSRPDDASGRHSSSYYSSSTSSSDDDKDEDTEHNDEKQAQHAPGHDRPHEDFHDAVEPSLVFVDNLDKLKSEKASEPDTSDSHDLVCSQTSVDLIFAEQVRNKLARRTESTRRINPEADGHVGFGFSRQDDETRRAKRRNSVSSIRSHNFGDKNFAFRWINDTFEEVALSHPSLDRMIGLVVSPQTRILLRAVVNVIHAFVRKIFWHIFYCAVSSC